MQKELTEKFDLCVIGCGVSGYSAAMRALDLGKHVCLIEGDEIGGAGVMWGALASKTMWELAKDYAVANKTDRGYRSSSLVVDYQAVRNTVMQAVKEKQYQMLSQIETFSPHRWKGPGSLTLKRGWAGFVSRGRVVVTTPDNAKEEVTSPYFIIATGSKPKSFPGIDFDHERILSSDSILQLKKFPCRMMIVGAGIVGCEYATIFSNFGQTKVYLVDHEANVIPYEDKDLSNFVCANLTQNNVEIYNSANLRDVIRRPEHLEVVLDFDDGHSEVVEVDVVLISIGRTPNLSRLNLENINVFPDNRGRLNSDGNCRVNDNLYSVGDVTHLPALVNIAEMEGRLAVASMFGHDTCNLNYQNMSTIMFFNPAVAAVGMNEKSCRKQKIPYRAALYSNSFLPRAIAMRAVNGFVKIIVTDEDDPKILGMRAAGPQVSSTVMSVALFMDQGRGIHELLHTLYPHPTMSEGIQECIRLLLDESVYKSHAFPRQLKTWSWHPEEG